MTPEIEKHLTANMHMRKRQIMLANFLGGLAWGLGSALGATVVIGIIIGILKALGVLDFINTLFPQTYR